MKKLWRILVRPIVSVCIPLLSTMKTTIFTLICMSMLVSIRSSRRPENDNSSLNRHQILHLTHPI